MTQPTPGEERKSLERDPHCGPVPDSAWARDAETQRTTGRVEIFNATRPGGLDGWTMDATQYQTVHDLILAIIDDDADADGTIRLQHVVDSIQHRLGASELFPKGRLTNYVRYPRPTWKPDARSNASPRSSPQRIARWRSML